MAHLLSSSSIDLEAGSISLQTTITLKVSPRILLLTQTKAIHRDRILITLQLMRTRISSKNSLEGPAKTLQKIKTKPKIFISPKSLEICS